MPNPHKVKFKQGGGRCTKNLQKLRRLPECGIFDRDVLPFHPVNPPPPPPPDPKHPFRPFVIGGIPNVLNDRLIPDQPERPTPTFPGAGSLFGGATGPGSQYNAPRLLQDETNKAGPGSGFRYFHENSPHGLGPTFFGRRGYHTIPTEFQSESISNPIQTADYRNQEHDRVIRSIDDVITSQPIRGDIELQNLVSDSTALRAAQIMTEMEEEDDGAGVLDRSRRRLEMQQDAEIVPRPRSILVGDPRDTEFGAVEPDRVPGRRAGRGGVGGIKKRINSIKAKLTPKLARTRRNRDYVKSKLSDLEQLHANMAQAAYIEDPAELQGYVDRNIRGWRVDTDHSNELMKTFVNSETGDIAVSFRGTKHGVLALEAPHLDDGTNISTALMGRHRVQNEQTQLIDETMRSLIRKYGRPPDMYTGHSRGGAEVQVAKQQYGGGEKGSTVFNSAPSATSYGDDGITRLDTYNDVVSLTDAHRSRSIGSIEGTGTEEAHRITNFAEPLIPQGARTMYVDGLNYMLSSQSELQPNASDVGGDASPLLRNRMRKSAFEIDTSEGMYRVRSNRGALINEARRSATRASSRVKRIAQDAQKAAARKATRLASTTNDRIQEIRANAVRQFTGGYERVVSDARTASAGTNIVSRPADIELADLNVRQPPLTEDVTGLREIDLDFAPFDQVVDTSTVIGRSAPKLSFSERVRTAYESRNEVTARNTTSGVGVAGVGFLAGLGVADLMGGTDYTGNRLVNSSIVGGASGAAGDVASRTAAAIGQRVFPTVGVVAEDAAMYTALRASTALLRGGAEGLIIGAAAAPLDMLMNDALMRSGKFSHAGANATSSGAVGLGTMATVGAISLAAAPETLGLSLVVGGLATAAGVIFGAITGHQQDENEKRAREAQATARQSVISTANARKQLLATLPAHNFVFSDALDAFSNKAGLGLADDTWNAFQVSATQLFVSRPSNSPAPSPGSSAAASGDQKRMNDLFSKYITHDMIERVCEGGADCTELRRQDHGPLTADEAKFLNDQTGETWKPQADMQVEMSIQELQYTQQRIGEAKTQMINEWNDNQKLPSQLDPYLVQTAYMDSAFEAKFNTAIKSDAQDRVIDAYASTQTKLEQLPSSIQTAATMDPEFATLMHTYYDNMETNASQLEVTVSQLVELQGLSGEQQSNRYEEMQFDRIKTQPTVVQQAGELAREQDAIRAAGFYDIDQAFMDTDPTDISQWHPSDSQILQAHATGMNLNQYVAYMHQLALGETGDYKKLPTYTDEELKRYGQEDADHFKDELQTAHYDPNMYIYDPTTRSFTLNPNASTMPNQSDATEFVSRFTPTYLTKARKDYATMIHGLNEMNQSQVDAYNTDLYKDLQAYGDQYNAMVANQNEYLETHAGSVTQLLHYHVNEVYEQYRLDYHPLSDSMANNTLDSSVASSTADSKRRLNETAAKKYDLTVDQYHQVKQTIQDQGIVNPSQADMALAIVKVAPKVAP